VWTTTADVGQQIQRLWDRGVLLAEVVGGPSAFPYRVRLHRPKTAELLEHYDEVRSWVRELASTPETRVEWRTAGDRTVGRNSIPARVWIDDLDAACRLIGRRHALDRFRQLASEATARVPALVAWMAAHPLDALRLADRWSRLLDVVGWMIDHPRSGLYLRQIELPGMNTKFIETYRLELASMLDAVLPASAIDTSASPSSSFARRYGFRRAPATVAFRMLDGVEARLAGGSSLAAGNRPVTLTVEDFARLIGVERVFVTENHVNFLAFPAVARAIVVFGRGNDVGKIAAAEWIHHVSVNYWGDIDTYGFAILDHLRSLVPHVRSLLMTRETLLRHEALWVTEDRPIRRDLEHLTDSERQLYDDLRDDRIRNRLRLEQEVIDYRWVEAAVRAVCHGSWGPSADGRAR